MKHRKLQVIGANAFPLQKAGCLVPSVELHGEGVFALGAYPLGVCTLSDFDLADQNNDVIKFRSSVPLELSQRQIENLQSTVKPFQLGAYVVYWHKELEKNRIIGAIPKPANGFRSLAHPERLDEFLFFLAYTNPLKKWLREEVFKKYVGFLEGKLQLQCRGRLNDADVASLVPHFSALQSFATTQEDAKESILLRIIFAKKYGSRDTENIHWWVRVLGAGWGINYSTDKWDQLVKEKQEVLINDSLESHKPTLIKHRVAAARCSTGNEPVVKFYDRQGTCPSGKTNNTSGKCVQTRLKPQFDASADVKMPNFSISKFFPCHSSGGLNGLVEEDIAKRVKEPLQEHKSTPLCLENRFLTKDDNDKDSESCMKHSSLKETSLASPKKRSWRDSRPREWDRNSPMLQYSKYDQRNENTTNVSMANCYNLRKEQL